MIISKHQSGFTAVELLITLFIAAAFLMSGYQLYSMIIRDGGETRARAKASNIAYEYLQKYKTNAASPCSPQTIADVYQATNDTLSDVTISASITCPYFETPSLSKISVTVKYNKPVEEVTNATYINL